MKKIIILFLAALILLSGCIGDKTVKIGDTISINYTGSLEDGTVFDTSIESVAKEYDIFKPEFIPLQFKVGEHGIIAGLNEGVIGMKVGETKTLTIKPEKAYGFPKPEMISSYDIIQNMSAKTTFSKVLNISLEQFESTYGPNHNKSDKVVIPETNINMTVQNISDNVSLSYDLKVGFHIFQQNAPWNMTVVKIDDKNVTIKPDLKENDIIQLPLNQFQKTPWNSTVIGITDDNITLRHNAIPETKVDSMYGTMTVRFNETKFSIDENHELAGKTLIFNVTLVSIDTEKAQNTTR